MILDSLMIILELTMAWKWSNLCKFYLLIQKDLPRPQGSFRDIMITYFNIMPVFWVAMTVLIMWVMFEMSIVHKNIEAYYILSIKILQ